MSAVLLGVFKNYEVAERVRLNLFEAGFPTDRLEVTASKEPGRAGLAPASSLQQRFKQHFHVLLDHAHERRQADRIVEQLGRGAATVTVHPRGVIETARALEILRSQGATEVAKHDLQDQMLEHPVSKQGKPWLSFLWPHSTSQQNCIYCRLFGRNVH